VLAPQVCQYSTSLWFPYVACVSVSCDSGRFPDSCVTGPQMRKSVHVLFFLSKQDLLFRFFVYALNAHEALPAEEMFRGLVPVMYLEDW